MHSIVKPNYGNDILSLCNILLIRSKSIGQVSLKKNGLYKGMNTRRHRLFGGILESSWHNVCRICSLNPYLISDFGELFLFFTWSVCLEAYLFYWLYQRTCFCFIGFLNCFSVFSTFEFYSISTISLVCLLFFSLPGESCGHWFLTGI